MLLLNQTFLAADLKICLSGIKVHQDAGYGGGAGVQNEVGQAAGVAASGSLPFTGLDLALLVIGGLMLLVLGVFLRRAAKRTT